MVPIKRRFNNKPIGVKSKALKDLEKGMTSKDMVGSIVSQKTLLLHGWKTSTNWQLFWNGKACLLLWFVGKWGQKVSTDGVILKEKALELAKIIRVKEF